MKTNVCATYAASLLLLGATSAEAVTVHKLHVASPLTITDEEVEILAKEMTAWMAVRATTFVWDVPCPEVVFVPGDKVRKINTSDSGTYTYLVKELQAKAPGANVMFVSKIEDCGGVVGSVGCGALGDEPFVVVAYKPYDSLLWLHERGHNVGLQHAGAESNETEIHNRVMYYSLSENSIGKTISECSKYIKPEIALTSVATESTTPGAAVALAPIASAAADGSATEAGNIAVVDAMRKRIAKARDESGLTKKAYEVVALPWVHGVPIEAIRQLSDDDVQSIRDLFGKALNPFQVQAITALALVGTEKDVKLIETALKQPMPAVAADSAENLDAIRIARQIKLAAPEALGVLANRTRSISAVETLKKVADLNEAQKIVGTSGTLAADLSRYSVKALNIANTSASNDFVKSVLDAQAQGKPAATPLKIKNVTYTIAPLSSEEVERMKDVSAAVKATSVDVYFKDSE